MTVERHGLMPALVYLAMWSGGWAAQLVHPTLAIHLPGTPWNWLITLTPPLVALLVALWRPDSAWIKGLGSGQLAIASLLTTAATCWPIAVFALGNDTPAWVRAIGLGDPLSSLPFAIALLAVVVNLATSLGRRLRTGPDRLRFAILHSGLLIAVLGGAAGHGGLVKARFSMEEGARPGDAATAEHGQLVRLPARLALDDFVLDRFPPMLLLAEGDRLTRGEILLGPDASDTIRGVHIAVRNWLPGAAVVAGRPVPFREDGANPAAEVVVSDVRGAQLGVGWLHAAGPLGKELSLTLTDGRVVYLEAQRPRRFLARVRVEGEPAEILVNRPLLLDGWAIYLLSYDEAAGPASTMAVFEAVEDRALPAVYLGIILLLIGVLGHLWRPLVAGSRS